MRAAVGWPLAAAGVALAGAGAELRRRWWAPVIVRDLLGREGGPTSMATGVNEAGVMVGVGSGRGFRIDGDRLDWLTELGVGSRAAAVDDAGTIVGSRFTENDDLAPMRWSPDGEGRPLPLPDRDWVGAATATTGSMTVGWCAGPDQPRRPWMWVDGEGHELAALAGRKAVAAALDPSGTTAGWSEDGASTLAHVWHPDGRVESLAGLGGEESRATACNGTGSIVGAATTADGVEHACLWEGSTARPTSLPSLDGLGGRALAISAGGVIAGRSLTVNGFHHACVWEPIDPDPQGGGGVSRYRIHDLGTLGGLTSEATGVNDSGMVVGSASRGRGAISLPLRPGGWSWEDRAFATTLDAHRG